MDALNEKLPGLPLAQALSLMRQAGLPEPRVTVTAAPPPRRREGAPEPALPPREDRRVLAVRDGELIVADFRTEDPARP